MFTQRLIVFFQKVIYFRNVLGDRLELLPNVYFNICFHEMIPTCKGKSDRQFKWRLHYIINRLRSVQKTEVVFKDGNILQSFHIYTRHFYVLYNIVPRRYRSKA